MINELEALSKNSVAYNSRALEKTIQVHLVEKGDIFYTKGRNLAKEVYRQVWHTENLIDGNDYGVIISHNGVIVGNMNLQLRQSNKPLKSEIFFGKEHWQQYQKNYQYNLAEVSALAIAQDVPSELRKPIMMMLIVGIQNFCRLANINFLVTVQHKSLIRILTKSLDLPFYINEFIDTPLETIPNDLYWNREESPRIFYLEPLSFPVIDACYSFFTFLNILGFQTSFLSRINTSNLNLTYSHFRKNSLGEHKLKVGYGA